MSESIRPDLAADLRRIHRVITRSLRVAHERGISYSRTGFPDPATREGYLNYVHCLSSLLHSHHLGEDEIAFPLLVDRLPDEPYDLLRSQHQEMVVYLKEIDAALEEDCADGPAGNLLDRLNCCLASLEQHWLAHILVEERLFDFEILAPVYTPPEQEDFSRKMTQHGMQNSGPDFLILPFIFYNLAEEDRAVIARAVPPVVIQELIPVVWKDKWATMRPFLLN